MKNRSALTSVILGILLAVSCLFGGCGPEERVEILGVWWWDDGLGDEYIDFARDNGVTEIYYCSSKFNADTDGFISKANGNCMSVYWLAGEYQWVEDPQACIKKIDKFVGYQNSGRSKFAGIHFDIEPHQHPQFKQRREELITKFCELVYSLADAYPGLSISYDIPFWLHDEVTVGGVKKPAYEHIIDRADRVTLMSYRDTAEKIYDVSKEEIAYAKDRKKTLNLGVETKSGEGNQVSFMEEGKTVMYEEIAKLRKLLPDDYGVVIHQIKHWYDLKD